MATRLTLLAAAPALGVRPGTFPTDEPADLALDLPDPGRFARVLAAPERRARETAARFGTAIIEPALRDMDYGSWAGRDLGEIGAADPAGAAAWLADPAAAPHGGDSLAALMARVAVWLDGFEHDGHTLAVTHPAVVRAAVVHALGAPAGGFWRVDVTALGMADLRRHAGRWTLRALAPK